MELLDFYKEFQQCSNIIDENDDGYLSVKYSTVAMPVMVSKKRLVLPTKTLLRNPPAGVIYFHPLGENPNRSESDIIKSIKVNFWLAHTTKLIVLASTLLDIAASPAKHKTLGEAGSFLSNFPDAEACAKALEKFEKIRTATSKEPSRRFFNISFKFGEGKLEGKGFVRETLLSFPVLDELEKDQDSVFGVKLTKKEKAVIKSLFEYVLGNKEERTGYVTGTNNLTAPYFECLAKTIGKIVLKFNGLIALHKGHSPQLEKEQYPTAWIAKLDNLEDYRGLIPSQEGNDGTKVIDDLPEKENQLIPTELIQSVHQAPEPSHTSDNSRRMDYREMTQRREDNDRSHRYGGARIPDSRQSGTNKLSLQDFYSGRREEPEYNQRQGQRSSSMRPSYTRSGTSRRFI